MFCWHLFYFFSFFLARSSNPSGVEQKICELWSTNKKVIGERVDPL